MSEIKSPLDSVFEAKDVTKEIEKIIKKVVSDEFEAIAKSLLDYRLTKMEYSEKFIGLGNELVQAIQEELLKRVEKLREDVQGG